MSDNLSTSARLAITSAVGLSRQMGHAHVYPAHLLLGLVLTPSSRLGQFLRDQLEVGSLVGFVQDSFQEPESDTAGTFSREASEILNDAAARAYSYGVPAVDDVLLSSALLRSGDAFVEEALAHFSLSPFDLISALGESENALITPSAAQEQRDDLAAASADVEEFKLPGKLADFVRDMTASPATDPVFGREDELDRLYVVLGRRSKNNPVLIGEPGVGKTAVVEALAQAIATKAAPAHLHDAVLLEVDMGSLVAGTRARGDFEERVKLLLDFVSRSERQIIVFIDEIHTIVSAGSSEGSPMGAGNLLKPALARGGIRLVGATTLDEYRKHIEKDAALERRFCAVKVEEPDVELAVRMASRWAAALAEHHGVTITDAAVVSAVRMSDKWISDRRLPDKAVDVLDEACARQAIARARGAIVEVVDSEQVARVLSEMTGVPLTSIDSSVASGLLGLRERLTSRVVGQDKAVDSVVRSVLRRRSGIGSQARPASFLFAGPTGVGKTELAKALADEMLGDSGANTLISIDCSELDSEASVAKLVGAPPGYVGYGEGGRLTEAIRRNKNAVVLFDEADKAHPRIFDLLLQMLEEGRITDAEGREVDCSATTVILTSNHGAAEASRAKVGFGTQASHEQAASESIRSAVKQAFRPEFLNRLDEVIVFSSLTDDQAETIAALAVAQVAELAHAAGVQLRVDASALALIARRGFEPAYGARSLKRCIQDLLTDPLADVILSGGRGVVDVRADGDCLALSVCQAPVLEAAR